jgi:hypothetical protein
VADDADSQGPASIPGHTRETPARNAWRHLGILKQFGSVHAVLFSFANRQLEPIGQQGPQHFVMLACRALWVEIEAARTARETDLSFPVLPLTSERNIQHEPVGNRVRSGGNRRVAAHAAIVFVEFNGQTFLATPG